MFFLSCPHLTLRELRDLGEVLDYFDPDSTGKPAELRSINRNYNPCTRAQIFLKANAQRVPAFWIVERLFVLCFQLKPLQ